MLLNYDSGATTVVSSGQTRTGLATTALPVTLAQNRTIIFTTACMEAVTIGLLTAACLMLYSRQVGVTSGNIVHVVAQTLNSVIGRLVA